MRCMNIESGLYIITTASIHDVNAMDSIIYEPGSFYIFDGGYLYFERLFLIHESKSFFVIQAKGDPPLKSTGQPEYCAIKLVN